MTPVRLEPAAPRSRVKHSITEPLRSHRESDRQTDRCTGENKMSPKPDVGDIMKKTSKGYKIV